MMYDITSYTRVGYVLSEDDIRSNAHFTVRTQVYYNGNNYYVQEAVWQSYVGLRQERKFFESEKEFIKYAAYHYKNGIASMKKGGE